MSATPIRVIVADDHPLFREGVVRALAGADGVEVVAEVGDGDAALASIREHRPAVAVLDYRMPGRDGSAVAAAVIDEDLPTRVLLLSAHDEPALVYRVLESGATGYLTKEASRAEIVAAVRDCAAGKDVLAPSVAAGLAGEIRKRTVPETPALSPREREILSAIAGGMSIPGIAKEMYLAPSTVKTHVQRLYAKLGVNDRGAAVAEAMRRGLVQ